MDLDKALDIAAHAMDTQTARLRAIAEKLANVDATRLRRRGRSGPAMIAIGCVKLPRVKGMDDVLDAREARRSESANLAVIRASHSMLTRAIDLLK